MVQTASPILPHLPTYNSHHPQLIYPNIPSQIVICFVHSTTLLLQPNLDTGFDSGSVYTDRTDRFIAHWFQAFPDLGDSQDYPTHPHCPLVIYWTPDRLRSSTTTTILPWTLYPSLCVVVPSRDPTPPFPPHLPHTPPTQTTPPPQPACIARQGIGGETWRAPACPMPLADPVPQPATPYLPQTFPDRTGRTGRVNKADRFPLQLPYLPPFPHHLPVPDISGFYTPCERQQLVEQTLQTGFMPPLFELDRQTYLTLHLDWV